LVGQTRHAPASIAGCRLHSMVNTTECAFGGKLPGSRFKNA